MKKISPFFLTILIFLIILSSCGVLEKEDPYKKAKEKHRFFLCKVNGKEWYNAGYGFFGDDSEMEYYDFKYSNPDLRGSFVVDMDNEPNKEIHEHISFYIDELKIGDNPIVSNVSLVYSVFQETPWISYYLDTTFSNNLYITDIDTTDKIIKGRFNFRAVTKDKIDTVYITDGEFDWKPYWYK